MMGQLIILDIHREQEFMVRWSNSQYLTFNHGRGTVVTIAVYVYTDGLNHHLKATCVECNVGDA